MFDNDSFNENNSQLVLSRELLALLRWIVENDSPKIRRLIEKAMASGLDEQIRSELNDTRFIDDESDAHVSIIEFLGLMETFLFEAMKESTTRKAVQKKLIPTIDQIDSTLCDDATVRFSVEKATEKKTFTAGETPKEVLFKELLRRWKPQNKKIIN
jgi:hypothetical protein